MTVVPPRRFRWRTDPPVGASGSAHHSRLQVADDGAPETFDERWVGGLLYPVLDERGRVLEIVCIHDDATERVRAEREIRELNAGLERQVAERTGELRAAKERLELALAREQELGQLKSSFVSLVSHEFRTPLGIILSASEILGRYLDTLDAAERREQLEAVKDNVLRMSGLMEEVLLFSRIEAGKLECFPEPLDLAGLCQRIADELRSFTHDRCPIDWRAENDLAGAVADESLLRHLLGNLLTNAVKYSTPGSPVTFTARREGGDARVVIADRGRGIPVAAQGKLFTAFHRAANVTGVPGTGLGLVIVQRCVELHGGAISIESAEGAGTTVTITLPFFQNTP